MERQEGADPDGTAESGRRLRAPDRTDSRPRARTGRTTPLQYLREVRTELRKVAWPSREDVFTYSVVVVLTLVVMVGLIFALNLAFGKAISALFGT